MSRTILVRRAVPVFAVLWLLLAVALADEKDKPVKPKADPAGTGLLMGQLRALFAAWDSNKNGFLEKEELARAFRGRDAKPYDPSTAPETSTKGSAETKPVKGGKKAAPATPPDYLFLVQTDKDGDEQVSREEFNDWAREYAVAVRKQVDLQKKIIQAQEKLIKTAVEKDRKSLEAALKKDRDGLTNLAKQMKSFEKQLQQQLKDRN